MENKKEITKSILKGILLGGMFIIAASSPRFIPAILPKISKYLKYKIKTKKDKNTFYSIFHRLKQQDFIQFENKNGQIYISLTKEGKSKAGKYQIDDLEIKTPSKWDEKWRILIFDIKDKQKLKREALRGKIKQLGLFQLQKSVWVYPYDFEKEIGLLKSFFGFNSKEMQFIVASKIENDRELKNHFGIR